MNMHYRAAVGLAPDFEGRTVSGLLVPYGVRTEVNAPGFKGAETFAPGAFDHQVAGAHRIP